MAKKNFTDSLMGTNRSKKLDMLVTGGTTRDDSAAKEGKEAEKKAPKEPVAKAPAKKEAAPVPEIETSKPETAKAEAEAETPKIEAPPKKKRGRKKKDVEKDSFFYTVEKEFLFEVRAAAFWDRRDISEFISMALKHYMYEEMGESEVRRAVREYKKRLEEAV
ncbi:hypothetical protein [Flavilitoribacter nigricans]|uniref:DUF3408 domain-containing protein n=1 Tax=Flavilitoribacter nigricans (strain ATCC 23147 / DSM 23189 / NBRC 102662 / NCIMB 1420 / SS-2) TaxID=1122177 RepID=A0A2D0N1M9_FLAN2|nr:hypothetical protein [Flavilitoribacter nigricans]PHN02340.1 hypothetical protein CRP01_32360 [Flavilitoribacter nigricans DSM 23189 = NBRC 102662]